EAVQVPLLGVLALGVQLDEPLDQVIDPAVDLVGQVGALEHLPPLGVDDLALRVHDVVVLEDVLARDEVLLLDLLLRVLDLLRKQACLHRLGGRRVEPLPVPLGGSSGPLNRSMIPWILSPANRRTSSSCPER